MTLISGSIVPALFFVATMVLSGLVATVFGPMLEKAARRTVGARAAFATALVSSLSAARTVKLADATRPVLDHLAAPGHGAQQPAAARDRGPGLGPFHPVRRQRPAAGRGVGALPVRRDCRRGRPWSRCR